jgi:hypothetical protein
MSPDVCVAINEEAGRRSPEPGHHMTRTTIWGRCRSQDLLRKHGFPHANSASSRGSRQQSFKIHGQNGGTAGSS